MAHPFAHASGNHQSSSLLTIDHQKVPDELGKELKVAAREAYSISRKNLFNDIKKARCQRGLTMGKKRKKVINE